MRLELKRLGWAPQKVSVRGSEGRSRPPLAFAILFWGFVLGGCLALLVNPASAQLSPGPLSRAHQSLDGTTNCTSCHKLGAAATIKCVECHTEIEARIVSHKGLHATYNIPSGSSKECSRCHSEHNGLNFQLIKWDIKTFDHRPTGYVLEGKHAATACNQCHTSKNIEAAARATIKDKDLNRSYMGLSQTCVPCHEDFHKGRLGANCQQCHNFTDWKTFSVPNQIDHSKTRYPLTGLHKSVKCEKCHTAGADNKPRYAGLPFGKCSDCHADPHHGSFPQPCASCHNTSGWKKVSVEQVNEKFDHSKTKYPLLGKHATVACGLCHIGGDFKKPIPFAKCVDCHKPDPHSGQFAKRPQAGECAECHTVDGFKPSSFGVKEHATSAYPLQAKHAEVACDGCHIPKGKDTLYKIKFQHCTDCHTDKHAGQFAAAPYFDDCAPCHNLQGYKPSTFSISKHKDTHFALTGAHLATTCAECHKESAQFTPASAVYHWKELSCTTCHEDPHKGEFKERMQRKGTNGLALGCEACHNSKSWNELDRFDHAQTKFPLLGAHRGTACIDCHKPPNMETRMLNVDFRAAPKKCEECHQDIHGGQFAKAQVTTCGDCHNSAKWKPSTFDHEKTAFSLAGAHQNVRCGDCHKLMRVVEAKNVLFYKPTPTECAACHGADVAPGSEKRQKRSN